MGDSTSPRLSKKKYKKKSKLRSETVCRPKYMACLYFFYPTLYKFLIAFHELSWVDYLINAQPKTLQEKYAIVKVSIKKGQFIIVFPAPYENLATCCLSLSLSDINAPSSTVEQGPGILLSVMNGSSSLYSRYYIGTCRRGLYWTL